jgi:hypothetical protein
MAHLYRASTLKKLLLQQVAGKPGLVLLPRCPQCKEGTALSKGMQLPKHNRSRDHDHFHNKIICKLLAHEEAHEAHEAGGCMAPIINACSDCIHDELLKDGRVPGEPGM